MDQLHEKNSSTYEFAWLRLLMAAEPRHVYIYIYIYDGWSIRPVFIMSSFVSKPQHSPAKPSSLLVARCWMSGVHLCHHLWTTVCWVNANVVFEVSSPTTCMIWKAQFAVFPQRDLFSLMISTQHREMYFSHPELNLSVFICSSSLFFFLQ